MDNFKKAAQVLKIYPKLKLGERVENPTTHKFSVHSTGPHTIKFLAEPNTTTVMKMGKETKVFKCIVEENGQQYKWYVPVMNKDGSEGHYLIERLLDVKIGEEITVELKNQGGRNFVDVRRAGEPEKPHIEQEDEVEVEDEIQIGDEEDSTFKFAGEE